MTALLNLLAHRLRTRSPAFHAALRRLWWRLHSGGPPPDTGLEDFADYLAALCAALPPVEADAGIRFAEAGEDSDAPWVLFSEPGVRAEADALTRIAVALRAHPRCRLLYADHYCVDPVDGRPHSPSCKPAFDPVRLREENYIGPCFVMHRELLERAGGVREDRHALLQAVAGVVAEGEVVHLPLFLHWRKEASPDSASGSIRATDPATPVARMERSAIRDNAGQSRVSVIVPTRDGMPHLRACLDGVLAEFDAGIDGELLVVDNGSAGQETLGYLARLQRARPDAVRVLRDDGPFNYSAINNRAAQAATKDLLLLLNDDVAPIRPGWLAAMAAWLRQPGTGAVGAHLHYPDGRVQHAGVTLGLGGVAGHAGVRLAADDTRLRRLGAHAARSVSAVTGACLLTRKHLYWEMHGLNGESLPVAFNDVDFCLKLGARGWRVICTPQAALTHLESVSRGAEDSLSRQRRFATEVQYMQARWRDRLDDDPYYSPHLSLHASDLRFRRPPAVPVKGRTG